MSEEKNTGQVDILDSAVVEESSSTTKEEKKEKSGFLSRKNKEKKVKPVKPKKDKKEKPVKEKKAKTGKKKLSFSRKNKTGASAGNKSVKKGNTKAKVKQLLMKNKKIAGIIKKREENEAKQANAPAITKLKKYQGIRIKLICGFLVPAVLFIVVGVMIYSKSKQGLTENSETLINTNVGMLREYFELGFENIELSATRLSVNDNVISYYTSTIDDKSDLLSRSRSGTKAAINNESTADKYILNVMTFANTRLGCTQTGLLSEKDDMYEAFTSSGDADALDGADSAGDIQLGRDAHRRHDEAAPHKKSVGPDLLEHPGHGGLLLLRGQPAFCFCTHFCASPFLNWLS